MAQLTPTFEKVFIASGNAGSETWVDLSSFGPDANSPIPSGQQLWLGIATFISDDKELIFEVRPNLATKSAGTVADTQVRQATAVPAGESRDIDFFFGGNIASLAPVSVPSTGVEKLWVRVMAKSSVVGAFSIIMFYTLY